MNKLSQKVIGDIVYDMWDNLSINLYKIFPIEVVTKVDSSLRNVVIDTTWHRVGARFARHVKEQSDFYDYL